jgi:hypothetical protein
MPPKLFYDCGCQAAGWSGFIKKDPCEIKKEKGPFFGELFSTYALLTH